MRAATSPREKTGDAPAEMVTAGLQQLAARHGMHARVSKDSIAIYRSETFAGQPVLRQDHPGGPLLNEPGRIIAGDHANAYLAEAARHPDLNPDDLYQQVIPDAIAGERAAASENARAMFSAASTFTSPTGRPWHVYADGSAAVATPEPPRSAAYYRVTTDDGVLGRWTLHVDGRIEHLDGRPQDTSAIAGKPAAAPGQPVPTPPRPLAAQPQPGPDTPAPYPDRTPGDPRADQESASPADWTAAHRYAAQIAAMRDAATANTRIIDACGSDLQNFAITFAAWARTYLSATATAHIGAVGTSAPEWARAFLDDHSLTADLTATLAAQVRQQLVGGPAPDPAGPSGDAVTTAAKGWRQHAERIRSAELGCAPGCDQCALPVDANPGLPVATAIDMHLARAGIPHTGRGVIWDDGTGTWAVALTDTYGGQWRLLTGHGEGPFRVTRDGQDAGEFPAAAPSDAARGFRALAGAPAGDGPGRGTTTPPAPTATERPDPAGTQPAAPPPAPPAPPPAPSRPGRRGRLHPGTQAP